MLSDAAGQTTGELRKAVTAAVLALDPDAVRRRREEAQKRARVECFPDPEGTATLAGRSLPPAEVLAADKRLCQVARYWKKHLRAAWKRADPHQQLSRPEDGTDLLRARAYLALLLGQPLDAPPADLLPPAHTPQHPDGTADPDRPGSSPADSSDLGQAGPRSAGEPGNGNHGPGSGSTSGHGSDGPDAPAPGRSPADNSGNSGHGAGPSSGDPDSPDPGSSPADNSGDYGHGASSDGQQLPPGLQRPDPPWAAHSGDPLAGLPPMAGLISLTLPLTTFLGVTDRPGEAAGYGPLHADTARLLACALAGHRATRWQILLTDPDGHALAAGTARGSPGRPGSSSSGAGGGWTVQVTAEPIATSHCDHRNAEPGHDPSPALQRLVRARTGTCCGPGCRRPAGGCDLDHTLAYDDGGITCECGIGPGCRRCHRRKQALQWALEQPSPGVMIWTSPAGRRYTTHPSKHPT